MQLNGLKDLLERYTQSQKVYKGDAILERVERRLIKKIRKSSFRIVESLFQIS